MSTATSSISATRVNLPKSVLMAVKTAWNALPPRHENLGSVFGLRMNLAPIGEVAICLDSIRDKIVGLTCSDLSLTSMLVSPEGIFRLIDAPIPVQVAAGIALQASLDTADVAEIDDQESFESEVETEDPTDALILEACEPELDAEPVEPVIAVALADTPAVSSLHHGKVTDALEAINATLSSLRRNNTPPEPETETPNPLSDEDTTPMETALLDTTTPEVTEEVTGEVPTAKKTRRKASPPLSYLEKLRAKIMDRCGVTQLPPIETIVGKFTNMPGVELLTLGQLAVINTNGIFGEDRSEIAKALFEFAHEFGGENILNECSEVGGVRVVEVAEAILRAGRLTHGVKVALVDEETIPAAVLAAHDDLDASIYQVWDGRHRTMALALLYGPEVCIPCMVEDKSFGEAYEDARISNDTRDHGRLEHATYMSISAEMTSAGDPAAAYAKTKGAPTAVTDWVLYQTCIKHSSDMGEDTSLDFQVYDSVPKKKVGMTTASFKNLVRGALTVIGKDYLQSYDDSKEVVRVVVSTINATFAEVQERDPVVINMIWTNYGTQILGKVLGEALDKALASETEFDATAFGTSLGELITKFRAAHPEEWKNKSNSSLYALLREFAVANEIVLPRKGSPNKSLLKT